MDSPVTEPQAGLQAPGVHHRAAIWQRVKSASLAEKSSASHEHLPTPLQPCTSLAAWAWGTHTQALSEGAPTQAPAEDNPTQAPAEDAPTQALAEDTPAQAQIEDTPTRAQTEEFPGLEQTENTLEKEAKGGPQEGQGTCESCRRLRGAPQTSSPRLERQTACRGHTREARGAQEQSSTTISALASAVYQEHIPREGEAVYQGHSKDSGGSEEGELVALERKLEMAALWALEHKMSIIDAQRQWSAAHCARFLRGLDRDHPCHPRHRGAPDSPGVHQDDRPRILSQRGTRHQPQLQLRGQEGGTKGRGDNTPQRTLSGGVPRSPYYDSPGPLERASRGESRSRVRGSRVRGPSSAGELRLDLQL